MLSYDSATGRPSVTDIVETPVGGRLLSVAIGVVMTSAGLNVVGTSGACITKVGIALEFPGEEDPRTLTLIKLYRSQ